MVDSGVDLHRQFCYLTALDGRGQVVWQGRVADAAASMQSYPGTQAYLGVMQITQPGRIVEVVGRTEPGSAVIINNEQVFSLAADGTFRHFTSPLPKSGLNQLTITAQNRKGDTNTVRKNVVIE